MVDRHHPGKAPTALLQMLADGSCLTTEEVEARIDLTRRQISNAAACLHRRSYLLWLGPGRYQLSDAGKAAAAAGEVIRSGPTGPRNLVRVVKGTLRERAWRSMRGRRQFTLHDLIVDSATADDKAPENNLHRYVRRLAAAGYLIALPRRAPGIATTSNGFKIWQLVKDTGPLSPVVLSKVSAIHDRNTGEDVPCSKS